MKQMVCFRVDFTESCSMDLEKIELLEAIQKTGSLRQAAKVLGRSYRYAWLLLDDLRRSFSESVIIASIGGRGGGGVTVTPFGLEVVRIYRSVSLAIESAARQEFESISARALPSASKDLGKQVERLSCSSTVLPNMTDITTS